MVRRNERLLYLLNLHPLNGTPGERFNVASVRAYRAELDVFVEGVASKGYSDPS